MNFISLSLPDPTPAPEQQSSIPAVSEPSDSWLPVTFFAWLFGLTV